MAGDLEQYRDMLIFEPEITIVARQAIDTTALYDFLRPFGPGATRFVEETESMDGELLAELAGRLCYLSFANPRPGGSPAYHQHIQELGHGNVYEHGVWGFILSGVSRSLSHELVRHSVGFSVSQLSQRYTSVVRFVVPPLYRSAVIEAMDGGPGADPELVRVGRQWVLAMAEERRAYADLAATGSEIAAGRGLTGTAAKKAAREAARSVLGNAAETMIYVTANARALRNVFEQRCSAGADAEMRRLALKWLGLMRREAPLMFGDFDTFEAEGEEGVGPTAAPRYHKI